VEIYEGPQNSLYRGRDSNRVVSEALPLESICGTGEENMNKQANTGFEVLTSVVMKSAVF
jgi:hypothetical protein